MSDPSYRDDPENHRYVVEFEGDVVGMAVYQERAGRHFFVHTEVDPEFGGRGWGTNLVRYALDDMRERRGVVVPLCPLFAAYIKRHEEYEDLVDWEITRQINEGR
jgi:predicted GNAT family acetyltransferase